MSTDKLAELFHAYTTTVYLLWGTLFAAAIAILGFVYKDGRAVAHRRLRLALSAGFLALGIGTCTATWRAYHILVAISRALQEISKQQEGVLKDFLEAHQMPDPAAALTFQVLLIALVLVLIWLPPSYSQPTLPAAPRPS